MEKGLKNLKKPDVPWDALTDVLSKAMSGMPCTNRETPAEKAAARKYMEEENARRRARNAPILEQLRKERADAAKARKKRH